MAMEGSTGLQTAIKSLAAVAALIEREGGAVLGSLGLSSSALGRQLAGLLGLADQDSMTHLREQVADLIDELSSVRQREAGLSRRIDELAAESARFSQALDRLVQVQQRCAEQVERMGASSARFEAAMRARSRKLDALRRLRRRIDEVDGKVAHAASPGARRPLLRGD